MRLVMEHLSKQFKNRIAVESMIQNLEKAFMAF